MNALRRKALTNMRVLIFIFSFALLAKPNSSQEFDDDYLSIPDDFIIGTASSAYQVEGAWNEGGKAESIWDYFTHNYPSKIADKSTGDIACDSYHKFKEDVDRLNDLGVNHYRFSLSWSRLLPTGRSDNVNKEGVRYYHKILDALEIYNIHPIVTIYHWDHPQSLEKCGGWINESMIDDYADYATFVFKEYGDRVQYFVTLNEPYIFCNNAYGQQRFAPGINYGTSGKYRCMHNQLKAHAKAYHIYDQQFRRKQNGIVGIVNICFQYYNKNPNDTQSADIAFEFNCGWAANPIFSKEGDYPKVMKDMIAAKSKLEGRNESRLPAFTKEEIEYIRGSSDYFGLNHYTSYLVEPSPKAAKYPDNDNGLINSANASWPTSQSSWLRVVPTGFGDLLRKIKDKYNNPIVYVMENGVSDEHGVEDINRRRYIYVYLRELLIARKRDNCDIRGYTYWSFLDSFEWATGYTNQFGLVSVDFNCPNRTRTPKKSYSWFKSMCAARKIQPI